MRKQFMRGVILLLAFVIAAVTPLAVFAQLVPEETGMEKALVAVKGIIDIDDDVFTDFSYSSSYSNQETREGLVWHFNWSAEKASISASVAADGTLLQYGKYQFDSKYFGFAELSIDEAVAKAGAFLKRAAPRLYQHFNAPETINASLHSGEYNLRYFAEVNGRDFPAAELSIGVNKFTGEITRYSTRNVDPGRFKFESATDLISRNAAVEAYAAKIGLTLEYMSSFDSESNKLTVFPAYRPNSNGDRFIGAKTGEVVQYVYDLGASDAGRPTGGGNAPLMWGASDSAEPESSRSVNITPAERAAIDQAAEFVTSEQALQKLLEAAGLTDLDIGAFGDRSISLDRDYYDRDRYIYSVNMYKYLMWEAPEDEITGLYGRVDAKTGRVLSFSFYYYGIPMASGAVMTEAQTEAAVDAFLKKIVPAELAKSKLEDRQQPVADRFGGKTGNYSFSYVRYENGIPFRDNGISVEFNPHTGKIQSYTLNWFENASFPSVSSVLTQQQALASFVNQNGATIVYTTTGEGNARIVYDFGRYFLIDPFRGLALDRSGKPLEGANVTPDYGDVNGHWSEKYVMRLLDNGVYLWSGNFEPDKIMTELEFLQYIMLIEPPYIARMEPQAFFSQRGIAVDASPTKSVTRQEAARIIAEYLGYGKLAEQSKWFVYPFNDGVTNEYKGHITICHMLGIMNGDADGMFHATSSVSRAHAAVMLSNLILAR